MFGSIEGEEEGGEFPPHARLFQIPPDSFWQIERKNLRRALFLAGVTLVTGTLAGYGWDLSFRLAHNPDPRLLEEWYLRPEAFLRGLPYALALMFILGSHELGHFLACRRHGIHCTPPFFIPLPSIPGYLDTFGTFGAFIRIKQPFLNRTQLFDVGFTGPLCGMVAALPVFIAGMQLSTVIARKPEGTVLIFGDSLLLLLGVKYLVPGAGTGTLALHPLGWAAFFGFLATSLNLLPIGQLDGGHIVYAVLGPRGHRHVSIAAITGLVLVSALSFPWAGYLPFALLVFFVLKLKHPPTLMDGLPLDRRRRWLSLLALLILVLTFVPVLLRMENI